MLLVELGMLGHARATSVGAWFPAACQLPSAACRRIAAGAPCPHPPSSRSPSSLRPGDTATAVTAATAEVRAPLHRQALLVSILSEARGVALIVKIWERKKCLPDAS